jgi:hypothetical protein
VHSSFDLPLDWDTSSVTDLSGIFDGAGAFSQDLSAWNVSRVTTFENAFRGTRMAASSRAGSGTPTRA